jgi:hypothetical protein
LVPVLFDAVVVSVEMRSTGGTTYMVDGRQYYLVPSGSTLTAFTLP